MKGLGGRFAVVTGGSIVDIASVAAFAACRLSDDASFLTGGVDGGSVVC